MKDANRYATSVANTENNFNHKNEQLSDTVVMHAKYIWAKSNQNDETWLPLWVHLEDALRASQVLWDEWVPLKIKSMIAKDLRLSENDAGKVVAWLAGLHDLGKATPDFSGRDRVAFSTPELYSRMNEYGFSYASLFNKRGDLKARYRHELAGCALLDNMIESTDINGDKAFTIAVTVAGHHGNPATEEARWHKGFIRDIISIEKDDVWNQSITITYDYINSLVPEAFSLIKQIQSLGIPQRSQILITSLITMSDWIASTDTIFPLIPFNNVPELGEKFDTVRYDIDLNQFDIPSRFTPPEEINTNWEELFSERFHIDSPTLHPVQLELYNLINNSELKSDIYIVEAPMGAGKTEAALIGSEILNNKTGGGGVFFGLPTMATSEALFSRVEDYLSSYSKETTPISLSLVHSKSILSSKYDKQKTSVENNTEGIIPEGWFQNTRMRLLNSFVVGTIDSFLMLSLKIKYSAWKHLGFASKTIILDEVHAADTYMMGYLCRSLEWAGFYECPVILLSATLDNDTRNKLIDAYEHGKSEGEKII